MSKELQLFKGGWNGDVTDRIVPNQRPADGHQKTAVHEDYAKLTQKSFRCGNGLCGKNRLQVGDVIGLHTTLTMGFIIGFGLATVVAQEGVKFKVVSRDDNVDLSKLKVNVSEWDEENEQYVEIQKDVPLTDIEDIGDKPYFYSAATEKVNELFGRNTDMIGLEVVEMPDVGLSEEFVIESRLHNFQPARPPASLGCC